MIIWTNILIMSVFHQKAAGITPSCRKPSFSYKRRAAVFVRTTALNCKIRNPRRRPCLHTIQNQLFSDFQPSGGRCDGVACVCDMAASSNIIRM